MDEGHLAFLIGDVCDKGVPGALYMMRAKSTVKELLLHGMPLEDAAGAANARLFENSASGMFVTLWLGILDTKSGAIDYINAGHDPPLVSAEGKTAWLKAISGPMLGAFGGITYSACHTPHSGSSYSPRMRDDPGNDREV